MATHGVREAIELADPDNEVWLSGSYSERCSRSDVSLNLGSTSLITNAYRRTGDDRYRERTTESLEAWCGCIAENGAITPDNVGLSEEIGVYTEREMVWRLLQTKQAECLEA